MCRPESPPDSMSFKNDEHNGQGRLQLQRKPASNWPSNPCTTRKSSFFAPNCCQPDIYDNLLRLQFMWLSVITLWRYICFQPFVPLIIVKGFVELLIYPRRTKTGVLGCFFFKEPCLSFIHGGGRHKLIHEVVKRREQNPIRMGANTMVQEGGSYDGKYRK